MGHPFRAFFSVFSPPGTDGPIKVSGAAATGYRTLGASDDGRTLTVSIIDGDAWENRTGCVYTHATRTLTRGTFDSSSTGEPINFSSAAKVQVEEFSATQAAGAPSLVSAGGTLSAAQLLTTAGTPGQVVRLSDGNDRGALLVWDIPEGATAYTWCWWLWPQSRYEGA